MINLLLIYLLNSIWQVPLLAFAAWAALALLRPSPRSSHLVWVATLLLSVLLPMAGALPGSHPQPDRSPAAAQAGHPIAMVTETSKATGLTFTIPGGAALWIVRCYLLTIVVFLVRLFLAHRSVRRMLRSAQRRTLTPAQAASLTRIADRLGLPVPRILTHSRPGQVPLVAGIARPALVLPPELDVAGEADFVAVVAHELVHLARRDLPASLVLACVSAPIAYHPATAAIDRNIRRTRELLADSLAATFCPSRSSYANSLLTLTRLLMPTFAPVAAAGLFIGSHRSSNQSAKHLEERVMTLIAPPRTTHRLARIALSAAVLSSALAAASYIRLLPPVLASARAQLAPQHQPAAPAQSPDTLPAVVPLVAPAAPPAPPQPPAQPTTPPHPHPPAIAAQHRQLPVPEVLSLHASSNDQQLERAQKELDEAAARLDTPEFEAQMQKLRAEGKALQLAIPLDQLEQFRFLDDPAYKAWIEEISRRSAELAQNAVQLQWKMMPAESYTISTSTPEQRRETARQLDQATASLDQALGQTHDPALIQKLNEAKTAIDKARVHK